MQEFDNIAIELPAAGKPKASRRERALVPMFDYCIQRGGEFSAPREWLLCLAKRAKDDGRVSLRKIFAAQPDGSVIPAMRYLKPGAFQHVACLIGIDGSESLHHAVEAIGRGDHGEAVLVRGAAPSYPGWNWKQATRNRSYRRREGNRPGASQGVDPDAPRHHFTIDIDKLVNLELINPVASPQQAAAWVKGLLSPALRNAVLSFRFSSSTGINPLLDARKSPISLHIRGWLDTPLIGEDLKPLLEAEAEQLAWRLQEEYGLPDEEVRGFIDSSVCQPGQQVYVLPPIIEGGQDPFEAAGTKRGGMLYADAPEVDVAAWRMDLQLAGRIALHHPHDADADEEDGEAQERIAAAELIRQRDLADFWADMRRGREATSSAPIAAYSPPAADILRAQDAADWLTAYRSRMLSRSLGRTLAETYAISAAAELAALMRARGGAREGQRYFTARAIASLLSHVADDDGDLEILFRELADHAFTAEWLDAEWWNGSGAWTDIIARFRGRRAIRCKRAYLDRAFRTTAHEIRSLGLVTLIVDDAARAAAARARKTAAQAKRRAAARTKPPVRNMSVGRPWEDLGISKSSYYAKKKAGEL